MKEVQSGYECGVSLKNFNKIEQGDILEFFVYEEIQADLGEKLTEIKPPEPAPDAEALEEGSAESAEAEISAPA